MENNRNSDNHKKVNNWGIGKIFWGLLFILIGGLILIDNFGLANVRWVDLWRLWPLTIVMIGLSILAFNNMIWRIVSVALIIVTLGAIVWVAMGNYPIIHSSFEKEILIDKDGIHITVNK